MLFTSSMRSGNNGVLLPLFFILPHPLHLSWHSWLHMVLLELEIGSLQCLDYPWNDWRRGGSTDSFWLAKKQKDNLLLFLLPIFKIELLVFCIVIVPDLMSHSPQTLHINMFMYLLAWLGSLIVCLWFRCSQQRLLCQAAGSPPFTAAVSHNYALWLTDFGAVAQQ